MPVGVPETEVFTAADRVLARGERPTVERVRQELGRGSPARVGQLLESWWEALAKRLAGHSSLPALPQEVASAFADVWRQAVAAEDAAAEITTADMRGALERERTALVEREKARAAALEQAASRAAAAEEQLRLTDERLIALQNALLQATDTLKEARRQRDALQERAEHLDRRLSQAHQELASHVAATQNEQANWISQLQALEDRASREIDVARQETARNLSLYKKQQAAGAAREAKSAQMLLDAQLKNAELTGRLKEPAPRQSKAARGRPNAGHAPRSRSIVTSQSVQKRDRKNLRTPSRSES